MYVTLILNTIELVARAEQLEGLRQGQLAEQERRRNHSASLEDVWEDEWGREQRGEEVRKPAKVARVDDPNEGGGEASRFGDEVARLWSDEWSIEEMSG